VEQHECAFGGDLTFHTYGRPDFFGHIRFCTGKPQRDHHLYSYSYRSKWRYGNNYGNRWIAGSNSYGNANQGWSRAERDTELDEFQRGITEY
jgi:hypothetical protein